MLDHRGKPTPETWPNTGIGRGNPDGSLGSCSACHGRHRFSSAQARTPDTCGKCHIGPDHPQLEVYNESKHGILYRAHVDEMNLKSKKWVAGVDYTAAPTCATCHMSATRKQDGRTMSASVFPGPCVRRSRIKLNMVRLENGNEYDVPDGARIAEGRRHRQLAEGQGWQGQGSADLGRPSRQDEECLLRLSRLRSGQGPLQAV